MIFSGTLTLGTGVVTALIPPLFPSLYTIKVQAYSPDVPWMPNITVTSIDASGAAYRFSVPTNANCFLLWQVNR
jgi:hypothetical protein